MRAILKALLAALGEPEAPPPPAPVVLRVSKPAPWTAEDQQELREFLGSKTGAKLCARARWTHLNLASLAAQATDNYAAQDAARGSVETLRFLLEMSGLRDLPDLSPEEALSNDKAESETAPSLHSLLNHTPDA